MNSDIDKSGTKKTPKGASLETLTLNDIDYKAIRQVLLDLLSQYQELEKPANPDLLKLHIENAEAKLLQWANEQREEQNEKWLKLFEIMEEDITTLRGGKS